MRTTGQGGNLQKCYSKTGRSLCIAGKLFSHHMLRLHYNSTAAETAEERLTEKMERRELLETLLL